MSARIYIPYFALNVRLRFYLYLIIITTIDNENKIYNIIESSNNSNNVYSYNLYILKS